MRVKTFVLRFLILACISSFTMNLQAKEYSLAEVKAIALTSSTKLESALKKELKKAKRKNGTVEMADFCINKSSKIIEQINKELSSNISIKRVSLNSRNEKSKALVDEINILKAFDLIQEADAYLPKQIVQIIDDDTYKVYSAVQMKSRDCKKCHGLDKKIDKKLKKEFFKVYKNSNAYGYKSGEVRGAIVVLISK